MSRLSYAIRVTLGEEGGYSDRKNDRGGPTNYGVTQRTYNEFCKLSGRPQRPVREINTEEVLLIYGAYWRDAHCSYMPEPLDIQVFDAAINHGARRAIKLLQQALGVDDDGVAGKDTMRALHEEMISSNVIELCYQYLALRKAFYEQIIDRDATQVENFNGWMNRIEHMTALVES